MCELCSSTCSTCMDATSCTTCRPNHSKYMIDSGNELCFPDCSSDFYFDTNLENCQVCNTNCLTCSGSSSSDCLSCSPPLFLREGSCLTGCMPGEASVTNILGNQCIVCNANCSDCDVNGCTGCTNGVILEGSTCGTLCATQFYHDGIGCKQCIPRCDACTTDITCDTCEDGWEVYNSICRKSCEIGETRLANQICYTCPVQCDSCAVGDGTCNSILDFKILMSQVQQIVNYEVMLDL